MKKISLLCAVVIAGLSLGGCGNGHHYNLKKLRAEHARLLKQSKKKDDKHNKKHSTKSKKSTKQSASNKKSSSSSGNKNKTTAHNNQKENNNSQDQNANNHHETVYDDPKVQENLRKGLTVNGVRPRSSFNSDDDYRRYTAWWQGYNYNPQTNTYSQMNDQQLNDMRQQMNANAGQNFK